MGSALSSVYATLFNPKRETRMLMLGLDNAGKTTILMRLQLGEVVSTIPTIGFNVEKLEFGKMNMTVWDIGGQMKIRPLWRHYYEGTQGLIYVVDSNDVDRIDNDLGDCAKEELHRLLAESELNGVPLLVLANKQDLPKAMSVADLTEALGLHKIRDRKWFIQGCVGNKGTGLYEGLSEMEKMIFGK